MKYIFNHDYPCVSPNRRWWRTNPEAPASILHLHRIKGRDGKWVLFEHQKEPEWFPSLKAAAVYLLCAYGMRLTR